MTLYRTFFVIHCKIFDYSLILVKCLIEKVFNNDLPQRQITLKSNDNIYEIFGI